jgi:hypothetical protein
MADGRAVYRLTSGVAFVSIRVITIVATTTNHHRFQWSTDMGSQVAPADQQNLKQVMTASGTSGPLTVANLKAEAGATNVYQFTKDFQIVFGQGICDFRQGGIYGLHAALKTALLAASAPMTQL